MSYWKKLLDHWQGPLGRHALSFSFIIGALKEYSLDESWVSIGTRDAIRRLIDDLRNYEPDGYILYIYKCPDIRVLVIRKVDGVYSHPGSVQLESTTPNKNSSLFVSDAIDHNSATPVDDLVEKVCEESSAAIEFGNYSRNGNKFSPFNDYEKRAITKALALN